MTHTTPPSGAADRHVRGPAGPVRSAPPNGPPRAPRGLIRLRFADPAALERAAAAFGAARPGAGLGEALSEPATLTLRIPGPAGVEALRAVLAVLDAAEAAVDSLTVHTGELDDVFAAFTALP